jgi:hypothetical protein
MTIFPPNDMTQTLFAELAEKSWKELENMRWLFGSVNSRTGGFTKRTRPEESIPRRLLQIYKLLQIRALVAFKLYCCFIGIVHEEYWSTDV